MGSGCLPRGFRQPSAFGLGAATPVLFSGTLLQTESPFERKAPIKGQYGGPLLGSPFLPELGKWPWLLHLRALDPE